MADPVTATQRKQEDREWYNELQRLAKDLEETLAEDRKDQDLRELEFHWNPRIAAIAADERAKRSKAI